MFLFEGMFLFKFGDIVKNKLKYLRVVIFCDVWKCFVVLDIGNNVVKVFGLKGKFFNIVGKLGVRKGELYSFRGVIVDKLDRIVVCDFDNYCV